MVSTYSFENNPYLSTYYAPGPEILKYLEHVGDKYKVSDIKVEQILSDSADHPISRFTISRSTITSSWRQSGTRSLDRGSSPSKISS